MLRGQNIKKRSPTRFPRIKPHITKYLLITEHVLFHTPHAFSFSEGRILRIQSVTKTHKEHPGGEYRLGFCLHINLSLSNSRCRACQVAHNFFGPLLYDIFYLLMENPSHLSGHLGCLPDQVKEMPLFEKLNRKVVRAKGRTIITTPPYWERENKILMCLRMG